MKKAWQTTRQFVSVDAFIAANFDRNAWTIEPLSVIPQGQLVHNQTGSIAVWWDILEQCVCYNVERAK